MNKILDDLKTTASAQAGEAHALPFWAYTNEEVYELERSKIFHNEWVFVCAENEVSTKGDYFALDIAGEPVVIVRGRDEELRALSNVCRHRGTILVDSGTGNAKRFVCPYHAWTYDGEGKLVGAPHTGNITVSKDDHCLPQFSVTTWEGLVFVNLGANPDSLEDRLADIKPYLDRFKTDRFSHVFSAEEEHWNANWKLTMENAMESYHLFKVHQKTLETVTPTQDAYYVEGSADWTITAGKMKGVGDTIWKWLMPTESKLFENYLLICIPPSFVGILTYESFDWIRVLPENSTECSVRSSGLYPTDQSADPEALKFVEAFFAEDKFICERVQRGMHSQHGRGGQLVEMERVVVDFHQYLATRLFGTGPPARHRSPDGSDAILKDQK